LQRHAGDDDCTSRASAKLRATYDEANSRLSQLSRLVMSLGRDAMRALSVDHAGLALFTTSLAMACGEDRNLAIHSFSNNQSARLAVSLRAAGLRKEAVEEQFLYIHPDAHPPGLTMPPPSARDSWPWRASLPNSSRCCPRQEVLSV